MTVAVSGPDLDTRVQSAVAVLKKYGAREIYLFGSGARGKTGHHSDLDLAVSGIPPRHFFRAMGHASQAAGMAVDLIDLDRPTALTRYIKDNGELRRVG